MRITFTSDKFLPRLPTDCQVNPGAYGFELAWWLAQELAARGVVTSYPEGEDWGWMLGHGDVEGGEVVIGCASLAEGDEGYLGRPIDWSVVIEAPTTFFRKWRGFSKSRHMARVAAQVIAVLENAGITVQNADAPSD
jgi:hypothetical protein